MDDGFYTSATGMLTDFNVESNVSDNMANMETPGYKERTAVTETFREALLRAQTPVDAVETGMGDVQIGRLAVAPEVQSYGLNLAQGAPRYTGHPLDLSLIGDGFFTVRSGGQTLLTRNGAFHRGSDGTLLSSAGYRVLGANGAPLRVPEGTIQVNPDGAISVDGRSVGRLGFARVPTGRPLPTADSGYFHGPGQPVAAGRDTLAVAQGYLETSNVDLATETTKMLAAQRSYQANARLMQMQDDTLGLAVNDLGKA